MKTKPIKRWSRSRIPTRAEKNRALSWVYCNYTKAEADREMRTKFVRAYCAGHNAGVRFEAKTKREQT